jgi:DNA-binding NarL/FixJ family response regulator
VRSLPKIAFLPHPYAVTYSKNASPSVRVVTTTALEAAIERGDVDFIYQMFATTARDLAQTGQGKELIKLSKYAGDQSVDGIALQKSFALMGHLVELDFEIARAMALELEIEKEKTNISDFLEKMIAFTRAYTQFANGNLVKAREEINFALTSPVITTDLGGVDKPGLIRMRALIEHVYSDHSALKISQSEVEDLINEFGGTSIAHHQIAIKALNYYEEGNYFKAHESAKMGLASAEGNGFVGLSAPFDCKYILARTLFEFAKLDQALIELEELKIEAKSNKSWLYYVLAESFAIRILTAQSKIPEALVRLNDLNLEIEPLAAKNDLAWLIDVTELFIRFILGDIARAKILIARSPDLPYVRQLKSALAEKAGVSILTREKVLELPEQTFKEQMYKYLYLSEFKAESRQTPKSWMKKALEIGEITGTREFFIRQGDYHLNLMIAVAKDEPSTYLEELVKDATKRFNQRAEASKASSENLTSREIDVLKHLATGKSIEDIGRALHISKNTMKTHLRNIYRKLEVSGRTEAVVKGQKLLLV